MSKFQVVRLLGAGLVLAAIAVGSFFAAQALQEPSQPTGAALPEATATPIPAAQQEPSQPTGATLPQATATPIPERTPGPSIDVGGTAVVGVFNGIEFVVGEGEPLCPGGSFEAGFTGPAPYERARGTVWEIDPSYLPAGAVEYVTDESFDDLVPVEHELIPIVLCRGEIVRSFRTFTTLKGEITIAKLATGSVAGAYGGPVSTGQVNGKPAVFIDQPPLSPEGQEKAREMGLPGLDKAQVIIKEDFGFTFVIGRLMTLAETIKVAEGLR